MNNLTQIHASYPGRLSRIAQSGGQAAVAALRQFVDRWRRRRLARQTLLALQQLDGRTLRDLGFDRSELVSVVAEVSGDAGLTRARLMTTAQRISM